MKSTLALALALVLIVAIPFALLFGAQFGTLLMTLPALACLALAVYLGRYAERAVLTEMGITL